MPIGRTVTFYTPLENTEQLTATGTYQGVATGEVIAPAHSKLNPFTTGRSFVTPLS